MAGYFAIFLVVITLLTGLVWLIDAKVWAPARRAKAQGVLATAGGVSLSDEDLEKIAPQPLIAEVSKDIFPVLALITIFRSFIFEPFQIPSGSMMPTMLVGDFILVQKYSYGIHDPVWRTELVETGKPERGDIAVFKYPLDERLDYIKRVVGLPGDRIVYRDKQFFIQPSCENNATECDKLTKLKLTDSQMSEFLAGNYPLQEVTEKLGEVEHKILIHPKAWDRRTEFYSQPGTRKGEWLVPEGHYFMIGDNRDNSTDSRFWGFVSEEQMVGKAVFIWMSFVFNDGKISWLPDFIPVDIRFSRLGHVD